MNSLTDDKFWELLGKRLSGEATAEELKELEIVISDFRLKVLSDTFSALWQQGTPPKDAETLHALDQHIERMNEKGIEFEDPFHKISEINPTKNPLRRRLLKRFLFPVTGIAAVFLGFIILRNNHSLSQNSKENKIEPVSQVTTKHGSKTQLQLPDGSIVWLNAGSNLTYDKNFGKDLREVNLTGEAFFEVTKNPEKPFIVHTGSADIKVLGTTFNVRSYPDDKTTETSLIKGSVQVFVKNRGETYLLKPNQKLVIENAVVSNDPEKLLNDRRELRDVSPVIMKPISYADNDTVAIETSWVKNKLAFKNEPLSEVAKKLERWFDVEFKFQNKQSEDLEVYGTFKNETLPQVMEALQFSFGIKYSIEDREVTIY